MSEINERQKRFCEEYIACKFNGTQAAINAGYSEKTARSIAAENLTKPDIQIFLSKLIESDKEKVGIDISKQRTLLEIGRLAFVDVRKMYGTDGQLLPIKDLDDERDYLNHGDRVILFTGYRGLKIIEGDVVDNVGSFTIDKSQPISYDVDDAFYVIKKETYEEFGGKIKYSNTLPSPQDFDEV